MGSEMCIRDSALSDINFDGAWTMEVKTTYTPSNENEVGIQTSAVAELWMERGVSNI